MQEPKYELLEDGKIKWSYEQEHFGYRSGVAETPEMAYIGIANSIMADGTEVIELLQKEVEKLRSEWFDAISDLFNHVYPKDSVHNYCITRYSTGAIEVLQSTKDEPEYKVVASFDTSRQFLDYLLAWKSEMFESVIDLFNQRYSYEHSGNMAIENRFSFTYHQDDRIVVSAYHYISGTDFSILEFNNIYDFVNYLKGKH